MKRNICQSRKNISFNNHKTYRKKGKIHDYEAVQFGHGENWPVMLIANHNVYLIAMRKWRFIRAFLFLCECGVHGSNGIIKYAVIKMCSFSNDCLLPFTRNS